MTIRRRNEANSPFAPEPARRCIRRSRQVVYSEGYKLPSLFALGYPLIANPELEPERGRSMSVGLEHRSGERRLRLARLQNRFENLIDFDVERFTNVNRARVRNRGIELEAAVPLSADVVLDGRWLGWT